MEKHTIETIKIENPCHESWENMTGNEKKKFCLSCDKHVHHLSEMTEKQVTKLLDETPQVCVRYSYDENGTIITLKEKNILKRYSQPLIKIAASFIGFLVMLGLPLEGFAKTININDSANSNNDSTLQYLAGMPTPIEPKPVIDANTLQNSVQNGVNTIKQPNHNDTTIQGNIAYPLTQQEQEIMGKFALPKKVEPQKEPCEIKKPQTELMGKPMMPPKEPPKTIKGKIRKPN